MFFKPVKHKRFESNSMGSKMCFAPEILCCVPQNTHSRAGLTVSVCFLWTTVEKVTVYQLRSALCCVFVHICVCLCAFVLLLIPEWFPEWLTKRRQCKTLPITLSLSLSLSVCVCVCFFAQKHWWIIKTEQRLTELQMCSSITQSWPRCVSEQTNPCVCVCVYTLNI